MDYLELYKDVECVACFDRYVLEYFIDGCYVHIENTTPLTINVKYLELTDEKQVVEWNERNIYSLPIFKKFME